MTPLRFLGMAGYVVWVLLCWVAVVTDTVLSDRQAVMVQFRVIGALFWTKQLPDVWHWANRIPAAEGVRR